MATKKAASKTQSTKAKSGKSKKGTEFEPANDSLLALAANLVEVNEPRPYKRRYPIPDKEFQELKAAAYKKKIAKKGATMSKDKGKKTELAGGAIAEFAPAGGAVTASANGTSNFALLHLAAG